MLAGQKTCNIFKSEKFVRLRYPDDTNALMIFPASPIDLLGHVNPPEKTVALPVPSDR
jgi:hypothetical protein